MGLSDLVGGIAKQLGGQTGQTQNANGLGDILGSVVGKLGNGQSGLNDILTTLAGSLGQNGQQNALVASVLPLILNWFQQKGGVQEALASLNQAGLTEQVQSWVGQGENAPVSIDTLKNIFNASEVSQVVQQTGQSTDSVYGALANALPQIVDKLTPQGDVNAANGHLQGMLSGLSGLLK